MPCLHPLQCTVEYIQGKLAEGYGNGRLEPSVAADAMYIVMSKGELTSTVCLERNELLGYPQNWRELLLAALQGTAS